MTIDNPRPPEPPKITTIEMERAQGATLKEIVARDAEAKSHRRSAKHKDEYVAEAAALRVKCANLEREIAKLERERHTVTSPVWAAILQSIMFFLIGMLIGMLTVRAILL